LSPFFISLFLSLSLSPFLSLSLFFSLLSFQLENVILQSRSFFHQTKFKKHNAQFLQSHYNLFTFKQKEQHIVKNEIAKDMLSFEKNSNQLWRLKKNKKIRNYLERRVS